MGNSSSHERQRQHSPPRESHPPPQQGSQQPYNYPPARVYAPPQGYQGYSNGQYYGQAHYTPNQFYPPGAPFQPGPYGQPPGHYGQPPGHYGQPPGPHAPSHEGMRHAPQMQPQEFQATQTIRNQVNLKKGSIRVRPLPENPNQLSVVFRFDATAACRASVFVNATDDVKRNKIISSEEPLTVASYGTGIDQAFPAAGADAVTFSAALTRDWGKMPEGRFGVVVRLEALTDEGREAGQSLDFVAAGDELPPWVQSQTTYAQMRREEDGSWVAATVLQKLWIKGNTFELQEIYGMEPGRPVEVVEGVTGDDMVEGNECVICMSEPRDTTVLPCRHMCMCHNCANELKTQTNKCPICRNVIASLLHIKIAPKVAAGTVQQTLN